MKANEYQELAARTISVGDAVSFLKSAELHALFGMVSEIGELHSIYQKIFHGYPIDNAHLEKELGDLLWFVAEFCTANGWKLEEIMLMNIENLKARYPGRFEAERSLNRVEGDI